MPESVPGPKSLSDSSGKLERTSFQLFTLEPVSQIFFSSATVRQVAQVFDLFTTTVRASFATVNARHAPMLVVLALHGLPGLHRARASERSVSLRQKRSKPPPVPEMPTVMFTLPAPGLAEELRGSRRVRAYGRRAVGRDRAAELAERSLVERNLLAPTATDASAATSATAEPSTESLRRRLETCFMRFSTP